jgi:hypothetical protein
MFLSSLLLLTSIHAVVGFTVFANIPAFGDHAVMILLSFLMLLVAGATVVACVTAVACISGSHSCCCWCPLSSWWFPVAGLSAIADVPGVANGVVGVPAVPFGHAVAGGPAVTSFPAVEGVLAVANVPADPGVYILPGSFP